MGEKNVIPTVLSWFPIRLVLKYISQRLDHSEVFPVPKQYFAESPIDMAGYTLFTGRARGSEFYWQGRALDYDVEVKVISFKDHHALTHRTKPVIKILTPEELEDANAAVEQAKKILDRKFPCANEYTTNLLRRNYHVIKDASTVLAITTVKNGKVQGGTAWGVVMADCKGKDVYVYDLNEHVWKKYKNGELHRCDIPTLSAQFAGIGSRILTEEGKRAIDLVFQFNFQAS